MGNGSEAPEVPPPMEQVEGYRDLSAIGKGATSWVYRAYQERVRRWVALKVLQADGRGDAVRQRFDRERSLLAELGAHPHIVQVLDAGRTAAGRPYVAMDLCDGSLADRVGRDGPLDWPEGLDLLAKIAGATQAAHDLGVLHRDIKPQNILVSRYGPLLADFGIARAKVGLGATAGTLQMSPLYAAPEVFFGASPATEASDVYSLGASLYAVLTGHTPFAGVSDDHVYEYLTRIQVDHPAAFGRTDLPGRLVEVVVRSLSADPSRRQPGAGRFADELRSCLHGRPLVAAPRQPTSAPAAPVLTELLRPGPPSGPAPPGSAGPDVRDGPGPRAAAEWAGPGVGDGSGARSPLGVRSDEGDGGPGPRAAVERAGSGVGDGSGARSPVGVRLDDGPGGGRRASSDRRPRWPPRDAVARERWRPAPMAPLWRRLAPATVVVLCAVGLLAAGTRSLVVDGSGRTSVVKAPSRPATSTSAPGPSTAAPAPSASGRPSSSQTTASAPGSTAVTVPTTAPPRAAAGTDPFPVVGGFGLRPPPDAARYQRIEAEHRRALTAAIGAEVPAAQTREVVAGGNVVGFVSVHVMPEAATAAGDRWTAVDLPGWAGGAVTPIGPTDVRIASSGKNWVASWWTAPNGFVAVFGDEAALRNYLAGLAAGPASPGG